MLPDVTETIKSSGDARKIEAWAALSWRENLHGASSAEGGDALPSGSFEIREVLPDAGWAVRISAHLSDTSFDVPGREHRLAPCDELFLTRR